MTLLLELLPASPKADGLMISQSSGVPALSLQLAEEPSRADQMIGEDPAGHIQQIAHRRITQGVTHGRASLLRDENPVGPEHGQLLGDDRLLEGEGLLKLLHGPFASPQDLEDADAGGMGERPEELGLE